MVRAEVMELKRIPGDMLMLRLALVNKGSEPVTPQEYTASGDYRAVSGVTLMDPINKKTYLVARDSEKNTICSKGLENIKPGERINVWARYPAPPPDVRKISLMIPHFPPIDDVPIGR
jgi:hypothetical protein